MPRSRSVLRSRTDSRSTFALKAPAKPWSLVRISTAARDGFSGSSVNGWVDVGRTADHRLHRAGELPRVRLGGAHLLLGPDDP